MKLNKELSIPFIPIRLIQI